MTLNISAADADAGALDMTQLTASYAELVGVDASHLSAQLAPPTDDRPVYLVYFESPAALTNASELVTLSLAELEARLGVSPYALPQLETRVALITCTNTLVVNAPGVGEGGGSCTCPDGSVYQVGDNGDGCGSLACVGGAPARAPPRPARGVADR